MEFNSMTIVLTELGSASMCALRAVEFVSLVT
jgi:hypothetical protein